MQKTCKQCHKPFETLRKDKIFCCKIHKITWHSNKYHKTSEKAKERRRAYYKEYYLAHPEKERLRWDKKNKKRKLRGYYRTVKYRAAKRRYRNNDPMRSTKKSVAYFLGSEKINTAPAKFIALLHQFKKEVSNV